MSLLSLTSQKRSLHPVSWRRRRRVRWTQPGKLASPAAMLAAIPSLPRARLARLTTRMIDRMEEIDGDADAGLRQEEAYE